MHRIAWLFAAALLAGACGNGSGGDETASPSAAGDLGQKPVVEVPEGDPPAELVVETLIEGDGDPAEQGDTLTVHYVGVAWSTGEQFDASWDRGQPFTLSLPGQVIQGWNEGLVGMEVGERRRLVIPPDKGYGETGTQGIAPNETLIFVIDRLPTGG